MPSAVVNLLNRRDSKSAPVTVRQSDSARFIGGADVTEWVPNSELSKSALARAGAVQKATEEMEMDGDCGQVYRVKGRKENRCESCFGDIPKGETHPNFRGRWGGEWQNWRMHQECYDGYSGEELYDGFTPGDGQVPERIRQLTRRGEQKARR